MHNEVRMKFVLCNDCFNLTTAYSGDSTMGIPLLQRNVGAPAVESAVKPSNEVEKAEKILWYKPVFNELYILLLSAFFSSLNLQNCI